MMNALNTWIILSTACYLFSYAKSSFSAFGESNLLNDVELKPMFTVNYELNPQNLELKEFYDKYDLLCNNAFKKYESLLKTVNNYVQRYVSLFLIYFDDLDEKEKISGETMTVNLEITISPEDLDYLQKFSKVSGEASVLRDLSRLDAILSKVVKRKERSFLGSLLMNFCSLLYYIVLGIFSLLAASDFYSFVPFLTILLVTWIIYRFSPGRSFYVYVGIIINSMIFWDSINLYRKKIKDVKTELELLKFRKTPEDCDPASMRWYQGLVNFFTGNRCLEHMKNLNRSPLDEVSLFQCMVETYSRHTIRAAAKILGASIRDFTGEISALWPWWVGVFINVPLVYYLVTAMAFSAFILCGKRLRLSFFGASVELGDSTAADEIRRINRTGSRPLVSYRSSRALARSRFLRRSELDLPKKRKSNLKAAKSECAIEFERKDVAEPVAASDSEIGKIPGKNFSSQSRGVEGTFGVF